MGRSPSIKQAIEVFVRGFAFTRSFTHTCHADRIGKLWVVRDGERANGRGYRNEEWTAHGIPAREVDAVARREARGRFSVCAIRTMDEPDGPIRADYKAAGYRLLKTEAFMFHPLTKIPKFPEPLPIERVATAELAALYGNANRRLPVSAEYLTPDSPRQAYMALDAGAAIGWATTIAIEDSAWIWNMYVAPTHRRRGVGKSLLSLALSDCRRRGMKRSVLLATQAGAQLYPHLGYEQIGELLLFVPKRK